MSERPDRPSRYTRSEPREILELRELKLTQPDLASAIDMQIDLVDAQRRVQARVPLPWIQPDPTWLAAQQAAGRPAVRFSDIPLDWTDFRLSMRQTADILCRHEAIDREEHRRILALARDGDALPPIVVDWYDATSAVNGKREPTQPESMPNLHQVLALAIRPFLARSAEALVQRADFSGWRFGHCPFCGSEPDFATITPSGDRRLICGRCAAQWSFGAYTCPFCGNDDRQQITSFATRDGRYRVYACDVCRRYLKAYDGRHAPRPVLVSVDAIATLPLDAAAIQRGYLG
ncbi:MAG: formate dehydrogenase accessory protein FdhE [Vicinamibacterales bacterium]